MDTTPLPLPVRGAADEADADDLVDGALGFAPHCPRCLRTCEPWQAGRAFAWRCPDCALPLIG